MIRTIKFFAIPILLLGISSCEKDTVVTPNVSPTVSVTSPADNSSFATPASITITATASDADGSIK
ncbi:MAG: Ig-like domain-containing protein [Chitinophagaceae bacterium]